MHIVVVGTEVVAVPDHAARYANTKRIREHGRLSGSAQRDTPETALPAERQERPYLRVRRRIAPVDAKRDALRLRSRDAETKSYARSGCDRAAGGAIARIERVMDYAKGRSAGLRGNGAGREKKDEHQFLHAPSIPTAAGVWTFA